MQQQVRFFEQHLPIIYSITLSAIMGVAIITPAFPKIQDHFAITENQVGLLITVFTLPGVFLTLFLGILADRLGRKTILVPSLLLFGLAGSACAFVDNFNILLALRFLQGIGAASLGSLNVTLIGDLYEGKARASVMGYNTSVLSIGTAAYPAIGGALATVFWYLPFLFSLLAIPVGIWVMQKFPKIKTENHQDIKEYLHNAWRSVRDTNVIVLLITGIITFIILYGTILSYLPFLLDQKFGSSTFVIGILMSSMSISTAVTSARAGYFAKNFSVKYLFILSFCLYGIAVLIIPLSPDPWWLLIPVIIFGIAQGTNLPNVLNTLSALAPPAYRAAFMSLNGMILRIGQTLGPAVMGFVYGMFAINGVFYAGLAFALIMVIIFIIFLDKNPQPKWKSEKS